MSKCATFNGWSIAAPHAHHKVFKLSDLIKVIAKTVVITLFSAYAIAAGYLYFYQRHIIYLPTKEAVEHPSFYGMTGTEDITLITPDHITISAWFHTAPTGGKTVVYFQGNNGNIRYRSAKLQAFIDHGFGIMAVSYRGYGNSEGSPSEDGLYTDARTAIDYLYSAKNIAYEDMVFYGESLGTGVAVQMATEFPAHALVLESPYTSLADIAHMRYPYIPAHWLLKDKFESLAKIGTVFSPVMVMHGYLDTVIPLDHSKKLLEFAPYYKMGIFFKNYNHTNLDFGVLAEKTKYFSDKAPVITDRTF